MSSTELSAGALPEYQPSLYVIHSPEGGSASDATSEHTQSQSIVNTGISTSDNRKGNDEKKSVSSVKAVREKGTSKNRAISTPRPLQFIRPSLGADAVETGDRSRSSSPKPKSKEPKDKAGTSKTKFRQVVENLREASKSLPSKAAPDHTGRRMPKGEYSELSEGVPSKEQRPRLRKQVVELLQALHDAVGTPLSKEVCEWEPGTKKIPYPSTADRELVEVYIATGLVGLREFCRARNGLIATFADLFPSAKSYLELCNARDVVPGSGVFILEREKQRMEAVFEYDSLDIEDNGKDGRTTHERMYKAYNLCKYAAANDPNLLKDPVALVTNGIVGSESAELRAAPLPAIVSHVCVGVVSLESCAQDSEIVTAFEKGIRSWIHKLIKVDWILEENALLGGKGEKIREARVQAGIVEMHRGYRARDGDRTARITKLRKQLGSPAEPVLTADSAAISDITYQYDPLGFSRTSSNFEFLSSVVIFYSVVTSINGTSADRGTTKTDKTSVEVHESESVISKEKKNKKEKKNVSLSSLSAEVSPGPVGSVSIPSGHESKTPKKKANKSSEIQGLAPGVGPAAMTSVSGKKVPVPDVGPAAMTSVSEETALVPGGSPAAASPGSAKQPPTAPDARPYGMDVSGASPLPIGFDGKAVPQQVSIALEVSPRGKMVWEQFGSCGNELLSTFFSDPDIKTLLTSTDPRDAFDLVLTRASLTGILEAWAEEFPLAPFPQLRPHGATGILSRLSEESTGQALFYRCAREDAVRVLLSMFGSRKLRSRFLDERAQAGWTSNDPCDWDREIGKSIAGELIAAGMHQVEQVGIMFCLWNNAVAERKAAASPESGGTGSAMRPTFTRQGNATTWSPSPSPGPVPVLEFSRVDFETASRVEPEATHATPPPPEERARWLQERQERMDREGALGPPIEGWESATMRTEVIRWWAFHTQAGRHARAQEVPFARLAQKILRRGLIGEVDRWARVNEDVQLIRLREEYERAGNDPDELRRLDEVARQWQPQQRFYPPDPSYLRPWAGSSPPSFWPPPLHRDDVEPTHRYTTPIEQRVSKINKVKAFARQGLVPPDYEYDFYTRVGDEAPDPALIQGLTEVVDEAVDPGIVEQIPPEPGDEGPGPGADPPDQPPNRRGREGGPPGDGGGDDDGDDDEDDGHHDDDEPDDDEEDEEEDDSNEDSQSSWSFCSSDTHSSQADLHWSEKTAIHRGICPVCNLKKMCLGERCRRCGAICEIRPERELPSDDATVGSVPPPAQPSRDPSPAARASVGTAGSDEFLSPDEEPAADRQRAEAPGPHESVPHLNGVCPKCWHFGIVGENCAMCFYQRGGVYEAPSVIFENDSRKTRFDNSVEPPVVAPREPSEEPRALPPVEDPDLEFHGCPGDAEDLVAVRMDVQTLAGLIAQTQAHTKELAERSFSQMDQLGQLIVAQGKGKGFGKGKGGKGKKGGDRDERQVPAWGRNPDGGPPGPPDDDDPGWGGDDFSSWGGDDGDDGEEFHREERPYADGMMPIAMEPKNMPKEQSMGQFPKWDLPSGLDGSMWRLWYMRKEFAPSMLQVIQDWYRNDAVEQWFNDLQKIVEKAQDDFAKAVNKRTERQPLPAQFQGVIPEEMWWQLAEDFRQSADNYVDPADFCPTMWMYGRWRDPQRNVVERTLEHAVSARMEKIFHPEAVSHARNLCGITNKKRAVPCAAVWFCQNIRDFKGSPAQTKDWRRQLVSISAYKDEDLFQLLNRWDQGIEIFGKWVKGADIMFTEAVEHFERNIHPVLKSRLSGVNRTNYLKWYNREQMSELADDPKHWPIWKRAMTKVKEFLPLMDDAPKRVNGSNKKNNAQGHEGGVDDADGSADHPGAEEFEDAEGHEGSAEDHPADAEGNAAGGGPKGKKKEKKGRKGKEGHAADSVPPGKGGGASGPRPRNGTRPQDKITDFSKACAHQFKPLGCYFGCKCKEPHLGFNDFKKEWKRRADADKTGTIRKFPKNGEIVVCEYCNGPHKGTECFQIGGPAHQPKADKKGKGGKGKKGDGKSTKGKSNAHEGEYDANAANWSADEWYNWYYGEEEQETEGNAGNEDPEAEANAAEKLRRAEQSKRDKAKHKAMLSKVEAAEAAAKKKGGAKDGAAAEAEGAAAEPVDEDEEDLQAHRILMERLAERRGRQPVASYGEAVEIIGSMGDVDKESTSSTVATCSTAASSGTGTPLSSEGNHGRGEAGDHTGSVTPFQACAAPRHSGDPVHPKDNLADSGASDPFIWQSDKPGQYPEDEVAVNKAGGARASHKRTLKGDIIIPDGARRLLPVGALAASDTACCLYIQGRKGCIFGKLVPWRMKYLNMAVEGLETEPMRNNCSYIDPKRSLLARNVHAARVSGEDVSDIPALQRFPAPRTSKFRIPEPISLAEAEDTSEAACQPPAKSMKVTFTSDTQDFQKGARPPMRRVRTPKKN